MLFQEFIKSSIHRSMNYDGPRKHIDELDRLLEETSKANENEYQPILTYIIHSCLSHDDLELADKYFVDFDVSRIGSIPRTWLCALFVAMDLSKLGRLDDAIEIYQAVYNVMVTNDDRRQQSVGPSLLGALVKRDGFGLQEKELFYKLFYPVPSDCYCIELYSALPILVQDESIHPTLSLIIERMWAFLAVERQFRGRECDAELEQLVELFKQIDECDSEMDTALDEV